MILALAMILDALLGEPRWLWGRCAHPAILMGRLVQSLEGWLNRGRAKRWRGVLMLGLAAAPVVIIAWVLSWDIFGGVFEIIGTAILLAQRSLMDHTMAVARGLRRSLEEGRAAVAHIVGRDPLALDETGVSRAAIESAAENFSDALVAPVFWFLIGGLPGIAFYKLVNTADSMIGHRNMRYRDFGWAAARLDDVLNWVPARLAGLLLCLIGGGRQAVAVMIRDAPLHRSPNAGWPESALAAGLGVSLSGPRIYGGEPTNEAYVNPEGRPPHAADIEAACRKLWQGWALVLGLAVLIGVIQA